VGVHGGRCRRLGVIVDVDYRLMQVCDSIGQCVAVFDTLSATTLHTIPTLTDRELTIVCKSVVSLFIVVACRHSQTVCARNEMKLWMPERFVLDATKQFQNCFETVLL